MRRGDIDDAAPLARFHLGDDGADGVKGRREIDGDDGVPFGHRKRLDRLDMLDAGIVDENIHLAEGTLEPRRPYP